MKNNLGRPAHRLIGPILLAGSLTATAGCVSSSDDSREPSAEVNADASNIGNLSLPIEPYFLSTEEKQAVSEAERILQTRCMKRFGFDYKTPEQPARYRPKSRTERRYGITDAKEAATWGYKPAASANTSADGPPAADMSPTMTRVFFGSGAADGTEKAGASSPEELVNGQKIPGGGCVGEARAILKAPPGERGFNAPEIVDKINIEGYDRSRSEPRVRALTQQWSTCMKEKGLDYTDPVAAASDPAWRGDDRQIQAKEITTAVADIECKKKTGLVKVWFAVDSEFQTREIEKNAELLNDIRKKNAETTKVAAELTRK